MFVGVSVVQLWPRVRCSTLAEAARGLVSVIAPRVAEYRLGDPLVTEWLDRTVLFGEGRLAGEVVRAVPGRWYVYSFSAGSVGTPIQLLDLSGLCRRLDEFGEFLVPLEKLRTLSPLGARTWAAQHREEIEIRRLGAQVSSVVTQTELARKTLLRGGGGGE